MTTPRTLVAPLHALLTGLSVQGERHLGEVQADLRQTTDLLGAAIDKLGKSFAGIHETMLAQQALLMTPFDARGDGVLPQDVLWERLTQLQAQGHLHANAAMTALQFEDMTGQLIGRIAGHVESLQALLGALGGSTAKMTMQDGAVSESGSAAGAPGSDTDTDAGDAIATLLASLNRVLQDQDAAAPTVARKTVAQTHMDSGDIELF